MSKASALLMAGGTGGHIFPGIAVANVLKGNGYQVTWLGNADGMEARLVPQHGIPFTAIPVSGLRGKGALGKLAALGRFARALWQCIGVLRHVRPAVVIGMGGYVAAPGGVAAWLCRYPLLLHEQNAVAGLTNRYLSHFAKRVFCAFPGVLHGEMIGNPVRADLLTLPAPEERFAGRTGPLRVLVIGGSRGAQIFNDLVPEVIQTLGDSVCVRHQTGEAGFESTRQRYKALAVDAAVCAFLHDMPAAYAWADVVIGRAGALTLAELASVGLPSILVPYPYAVDDHQAENARWLVDAGGARMIRQDMLSAAVLAQELLILTDRGTQLAMARAAHAQRLNGAAEAIAAACDELLDAGNASISTMRSP